MLKFLKAFIILLSILLPKPALSISPSQDYEGNFYAYDLPPYSFLNVTFDGQYKSIKVATNACGYLIVRNTPKNKLDNITSITINGTASIVPSAIDTVPRCTNGVADATRLSPFKTAAGDFVYPNQIPLKFISVGFPDIPLTQSFRVNACGFVKIPLAVSSNSGMIFGNTFIFPLTIGRYHSPICKNNWGNNVLYLPVDQRN